jgi:hypothetical protein
VVCVYVCVCVCVWCVYVCVCMVCVCGVCGYVCVVCVCMCVLFRCIMHSWRCWQTCPSRPSLQKRSFSLVSPTEQIVTQSVFTLVRNCVGVLLCKVFCTICKQFLWFRFPVKLHTCIFQVYMFALIKKKNFFLAWF